VTAARIGFASPAPREDAPAVHAAISRVVASGWFVLGPEVEAFESEFAHAMGAAHAVGVGTGTDAIALILRALGIGPGDEVVTTPVSAAYSALAVMMTGARPVFADVDPATLTIDPARIEEAIGPRTRAILPVHLYGQAADMDAIERIAARHGVAIVEDCCQAHLATSSGRPVGSIGVAGAFSFYPTKNLGAFGDAGIVTTDDDELAARIRLLRDHGRVSKYEHDVVGYTARLDNLQAAVLRVQADMLDEWNARRRQAAKWYEQALPASLSRAKDDPQNESVYHLFVVRVPKRDEFRAHLDANGVATAIHYPVPVHLQPAYRELGYSVGDFPVTERLTREIVSLPMHPFLTQADVQHVADVAADFLSRC
jgi:dTDP-4-amino-4,6-dideoxygalactose transaminase